MTPLYGRGHSADVAIIWQTRREPPAGTVTHACPAWHSLSLMQSGRALQAVSVDEVQMLHNVLLRALRFMSQARDDGSHTYCVPPLLHALALSLVHCTHAPAKHTFLPAT